MKQVGLLVEKPFFYPKIFQKTKNRIYISKILRVTAKILVFSRNTLSDKIR